MIAASDREYKATKLIKQGKKRLADPFEELARWIKDTRQVSVLNVVYDRRNSLHAPRLQVILEYQEDTQKFRNGVNFDEKEQKSIAEKFLQIIHRDGMHEFDVDGLFVVFSAFSRIAKEEADSRISEEEIDALKVRIGNCDLWDISRCVN